MERPPRSAPTGSGAKRAAARRKSARRRTATASRRGRPSIPDEVQRERLLEAARRALQESDFGSVRVADVVRAAGMSSRSFYDHFDTKEDLLLALIHQAGGQLIAQLEAIFAQALAFEVKTSRALAAYIAAFAGTPLDLEKLGESASAPVQKLLRHYVREVGVRVAGQLERAHREGASRRPADPVVLEVLLLGLLGIASSWVADGRRDELASLQPTLLQFLLRVWA